ncbi:SDR family NAD(P)-dependent oxidoreductase [Rhodococcus sp. H29-C3]|uniref:SDR family NAD(P)-dependent oxidoreductase n=1 Tax=Rhodococcus sp. H29-C3 TaxID=3046307 RepID=UPI0024B8E831|nr:SDR family NAD(P)-dependent oxidoreductase [Rhodococcus sp. H29-C3]MDJ0363322.1 SDR family NAD(P)-dependent oxidoreductase [Rhodococcus sp. H29-C3]
MTTTQTWVITGASGGLGLALVKQALAAGHTVVATTRGTTVPITDPRLTVLQLDPSNRAACHRTVEDITRTTGRLDVLINNAGYGLVGAIEEATEDEVRAIIDVDLLGPLWLTQAALPVMRAQGSGDIVQISSVGAVGAMAFFGLYNAAKWGLEGFSEALAAEVAPMGIRVTLAQIGAMDTQWATAGMQFSRPRTEYDEIRSNALGTSDVPWPSEPGATGGGTSPEIIAEALAHHLAQSDSRPLRLVIGDDAAAQITAVLDLRQQEYATQPGFQTQQH